MAKIGNPIRRIEVRPLEEPDPTYVPDEPAVPVEEPEKEPVHDRSSALH